MASPSQSHVSALDHREVNADMSVFATHPLVGAGLPMWMPGGAAIRHELQRLAEEIARRNGCQPVYSPVLAKRALFEQSGHWAKFKDDIFPPMQLGGDELVLRPANCPHHAMIYASQHYSYRQLPIRLHELAPMFRAERSGVLAGLNRVRQINLDDTHVFCRPDQLISEIARALRAALDAQHVMGLPVDYVRLSRGAPTTDSYLGTVGQWQDAEQALRTAARQVLAAGSSPIVEAAGEAAFYGPKLDLQTRSFGDREESIATVQVDFNLPQRFDLTYTASDGNADRVVMVHCGTVGSMERITAMLLEHYRGRLPLWLAPTQICLLPVGPDQDSHAQELHHDLTAAGLRVRLDTEKSLAARIRDSRCRRDSVIAVIGPKEAATAMLHVTDPAAQFSGPVSRSNFLAITSHAYSQRLRSIQWQVGSAAANRLVARLEVELDRQ
jgi:threonyl-tRNA synthetase